MDTTELLKAAMEAVNVAGVPKELQATALELAVADLRGGVTRQRGPGARGGPPTKGALKSRQSGHRGRAHQPAAEGAILSRIPTEATFFKAIEKETGVPTSDLSDIFHVDNGDLELKVASRSLGTTKRAQTQTVTTLLGGAVFGGTGERKLSFGEINRVCEAKHCFDSANSANSIRATPGFGSLGFGKVQAIVTRSGWQHEFARAACRVLGKPDPEA